MQARLSIWIVDHLFFNTDYTSKLNRNPNPTDRKRDQQDVDTRNLKTSNSTAGKTIRVRENFEPSKSKNKSKESKASKQGYDPGTKVSPRAASVLGPLFMVGMENRKSDQGK